MKTQLGKTEYVEETQRQVLLSIDIIIHRKLVKPSDVDACILQCTSGMRVCFISCRVCMTRSNTARRQYARALAC